MSGLPLLHSLTFDPTKQEYVVINWLYDLTVQAFIDLLLRIWTSERNAEWEKICKVKVKIWDIFLTTRFGSFSCHYTYVREMGWSKKKLQIKFLHWVQI